MPHHPWESLTTGIVQNVYNYRQIVYKNFIHDPHRKHISPYPQFRPIKARRFKAASKHMDRVKQHRWLRLYQLWIVDCFDNGGFYVGYVILISSPFIQDYIYPRLVQDGRSNGREVFHLL